MQRNMKIGPKLIFFPPHRFLPMLMPKTEDGKTSGPDLSMLRLTNNHKLYCYFLDRGNDSNNISSYSGPSGF